MGVLPAGQNVYKKNREKTKCLLFTQAKKYDFIPELSMSDNTRLKIVKEMKLVGYQIRSHLSTKSNTKFIVGQAWKRVSIIRRLISLGASEADLLKVLSCQVLSVLQFAVQAWTTMLTIAEVRSIEAVQKSNISCVCCQVLIVHLGVTGSKDKNTSRAEKEYF